MPLVSVILTTKNEQNYIRNCLDSIRNQNFHQENIEIIVVDNNSTDKTKEIARAFTDKIYNHGPERSAQRNFGIKQASEKYILYLDADMVLSENVIEKCVNKCENENCVALYIPERIVGKRFWAKVRDFERSFYNATAIDCIRFVRRDKFLEIDGFDENLTGPEDWDFDRRIKEIGKVGIITSPIYHNEGKFNFKRYLSKKGYYAQSFDKYIQKWGKDDPIIKKQLGFSYRLFGVFTENRKWKKLLRHPILAMGVYFLRLLVGLFYIKRKQMPQKSVLILTPFFSPNVGGVETHLDNLCEYLRTHDYRVYVVTYQPLTTKAKGLKIEKKENLEIHRIWWPGFNLFHRLEPYPMLEFLYLTPRLFISLLLFLLKNKEKIDVIHAQGFNASFIVKVLSKVFNKKFIASTHAIYELAPQSLMTKVIKWALSSAHKILALSQPSKRELIRIGLTESTIGVYRYWVDQNLFRPFDKAKAKKKLNWEGRFVVLFVGRFIRIKGAYTLLEIAKEVSEDIYFAFIGDGPLREEIRKVSNRIPNVIFIGRVENQNLPIYYNAADILCVPSQYEEGFGRVILEALSCGTPVLASNKGGIPEALGDRVGICIEPTARNIRRAIENLYTVSGRLRLRQLQSYCREYALANFSEKNAELIVGSYHG